MSMLRYVLGVGGTGTKCVEAFVHLCAIGMVPTDEIIELRIVDIHEDSGNLERLRALVGHYSKCRELVQNVRKSNLFMPMLSVGARMLWTTHEPGDNDAKTLGGRIAMLSDDERLLMQALYSEEERTMDLSIGVRGRPTVGALVCAERLNLNDENGFWGSLFGQEKRTQMGQNPVRVAVLGSIFGGTGASCMPTLIRAIRNWAVHHKINNFHIAAMMMLPYFSFGKGQEGEVRAASDKFINNSKAAMEYYRRSGMLGVADALYVLGDDITDERVVPYTLGSKDEPPQCNDAMPVELAAAGAVYDYLFDFQPDQPALRCLRRRATDVNAQTYPWKQFNQGEALGRACANLLRCAMLFNYYYLPTASTSYQKACETAALVHFFGDSAFHPDRVGGWKARFAPVECYFNAFIGWMMQLKRRGAKMIDPHNQLPDAFADLLNAIPRPISLTDRAKISVNNIADANVPDGKLIWEALLCNANAMPCRRGETNPYGAFLTQLYRCCEIQSK